MLSAVRRLLLADTTSRAGVVSLDIRGCTKAGVRPVIARDVLIATRATGEIAASAADASVFLSAVAVAQSLSVRRV
jgi:hypothetical protein